MPVNYLTNKKIVLFLTFSSYINRVSLLPLLYERALYSLAFRLSLIEYLQNKQGA